VIHGVPLQKWRFLNSPDGLFVMDRPADGLEGHIRRASAATPTSIILTDSADIVPVNCLQLAFHANPEHEQQDIFP